MLIHQGMLEDPPPQTFKNSISPAVELPQEEETGPYLVLSEEPMGRERSDLIGQWQESLACFILFGKFLPDLVTQLIVQEESQEFSQDDWLPRKSGPCEAGCIPETLELYSLSQDL